MENSSIIEINVSYVCHSCCECTDMGAGIIKKILGSRYEP
ncbi:hypothetical protein SAMN05421760_104152 [Neptunomonas antarctica]|uniref:Uncharacterized protein n=1 Tax=Neptunomonas antarctica TaxID=619304 RepID=A0A1N7LM77_9GAMM|nr:hypothetical protein SAMN05421760_104152 [Neptunomonas antarctica]